MSSSPSASSSSVEIATDGWKNCWAIKVGMKADRMTTVTSSVYWFSINQIVGEAIEGRD